MKMFRFFMQYLKEHQTPAVRRLHVAVIILVLSQIVISNFMSISDTGKISSDSIEFYGTWLHILVGILIIPVSFAFVTVVIKEHGFKHYYPYLVGIFSQLISDIQQLMKFKLPESSPHGLASIVQGLGLGALLLVAFSGLSWFLAWSFNLPWANDVKEIHMFFTGLIQAYLIGHGFVGILHVYLHSKLNNK